MTKQKQTTKRHIILLTAVLIGIALIGNAEVKVLKDFEQTFITFKAMRHLPINEDRTDLTVEEQIRNIVRKNNFKWEDYAVNMACCEGLFSTSTINTAGNNPTGSRDRGLYGINDYWHEEVSDECSHDLLCSTEWMMWMVESGHQEEFMCDSKIKGKKDYHKTIDRCVLNNK